MIVSSRRIRMERMPARERGSEAIKKLEAMISLLSVKIGEEEEEEGL